MKKYGISGGPSAVGFQIYAVPDTAVTAPKQKTKGWFFRGAIILSVMALLVVSSGLYPAPNQAKAAGDFQITCGNVDVQGDVWTFTGTWQVIDFPGLSTQYDVAIFAPTSAASPTDGSSKDAPDTFVIMTGPANTTGGPQDDMSGTWSNQITFATPPASVSATLFHANVTGAESGDGTCSFTLPPTTGSLLVTKNTVNGNGTFDFTGSGSIGAFQITTAANTGNQTFNSLTPGSFTITEGSLPAGWSKTGDTCVGVSVVANQQASCTITNTFDQGGGGPTTGHIVVDKVTDPSGDPQSFHFNASGGTYADFDLTDTDTPNDQELAPGTYTIAEDLVLPTGWTLSNVECIYDNQATGIDVTNGKQVVLDAGDTVTCTFTNTFSRTPTYSISGKVYNDNSPEDGTFDGEAESGLSGWTVYLDGNDSNDLDGEEQSTESDVNGDYSFTGLLAGCYTVREVLQSGWNQTDPTEDPDGVENDFEYEVAIGDLDACDPITFLGTVKDFFIHTASAAVIDPNATGLNFGNVAVPTRSGGGGGGSSSNDDDGRVLGDSTSIPYIAPDPVIGQVLGAATTLPVTGTPISIMLMIMAVAGFIVTPLAATGAFKKD